LLGVRVSFWSVVLSFWISCLKVCLRKVCIFWFFGCLGFVSGFGWFRLKNVMANACFHCCSSCSSDSLRMRTGIFSPIFIGFGALMYTCQIFDFASMYVDKTGVGDAIVDEIDEIGIPNVEGVLFTDRSKEEIFTYLKLLMEQKKLGILSDDAELIAQMNEQQYEYLQPKTARERVHLKFWHPPRRHDDQLFALALACYASKEEEPTLVVIPR